MDVPLSWPTSGPLKRGGMMSIAKLMEDYNWSLSSSNVFEDQE